MKDFYEKENYIIEDVLALIENEVEESIHLDFKESRALEKVDSKRREISKDVASFANSDGGLIIYGISEKEHRAHELSPIDGNIFTKEWLEQIINSSIQRRISGVKVFPIRHNGKIEESIYVVQIPKSLDQPHISKDRRFYKRFNFESVAMEEYEIRQSYGLRLKSKLALDGLLIHKIKETDQSFFIYTFEVAIMNVGDTTETNFKVNVHVNGMNPYLTFNWEQPSNNEYTRMVGKELKISCSNKSAIYPKERFIGIRFNITIKQKDILKALENVNIHVKLLYPNGSDDQETTLIKILEKHNL